MALSTRTLTQSWDRVQNDLGLDVNTPSYALRISDAKDALRMVVGLFYDLMASHYKTRTTLVVSTTGAFYSSGASWAASTSRLTATMNRDFASSDVGNLVTFHKSTDVYVGVITAFVSTTVVELGGDNLPTADVAAITYVILAATSPTSNVASLSSLDMMRAGQQIEINLFTSLTTSTSVVRTKAASPEEITTFRASAVQNQNLILYALSGNNLYLAKGSNLSSYGTLTLEYPGQPTSPTADSSTIDIPDGTPWELFILYWEKLVAAREGLEIKNYIEQIELFIKNLYATFQSQVTTAEVKDKIAKLK